MNSCLCVIRKNAVTNDFFYHIQAEDGNIFFISRPHKSDNSYLKEITELQNQQNLSNLSFKIVDVTSKLYFYKVFYDGKEIGTTISCENKTKCEQKKDQFMNFIKNSQYKIHNLAENIKKEDSLKLDSSIIDYMFSLDGMGMKKNGEPDSQNPTNFHQWENPNSIFYSDSELREKFLMPLFRLNK